MLTLDMGIAIFLALIVMGMAAMGGIAQVRPPQSEDAVQIYIFAFVVLAMTGVTLVFWQALRAENYQHRQDRKLDEMLAEQRTLKGMVVQQTAPKPAPVTVPETIRVLGNPELREKVIALANDMRNFEHHFKSRELQLLLNRPSLTGTEEEKNLQWKQQVNTDIQQYQAYQNEFRKRFFGEASSYRDELLRRLNIMPPDEEKRVVALEGALAGPAPISDLAAYLEKLVRQLPQ